MNEQEKGGAQKPEAEQPCQCGCADLENDELDEMDDFEEEQNVIDMSIELASDLCKAALKGQRVQLRGVTPEENGQELASLFRATLEGVLEVFLPEDDDEDEEDGEE